MIYSFIHPPYTIRHLLYHMIGGLFMAIDGILVVLSLGIIVPGLVVEWNIKWGERFYQHDNNEPQPAMDAMEAARHSIAEELGVRPDQVTIVDAEELALRAYEQSQKGSAKWN
jgi:hypothetical protein